jgi:hypothetical protein
MPIRHLLEGGRFHADSVAILVDAFNGVVDELGLQAPAVTAPMFRDCAGLVRAGPLISFGDQALATG